MIEVKEEAKNFLSQYNHRSWRNEFITLIKSMTKTEEIAGLLVALSSEEIAYDKINEKVLNYSDYENILAKAFSLALGPEFRDRDKTIEILTSISEQKLGITEEAAQTAKSYLNILALKKTVTVTTLWAMYREQQRIRPVEEGGLDFLRIKIEQLEDLASVNGNFQWEINIVNDGEDKHDDSSGKNSIELAKDIVTEDFPHYINDRNTGKIRFFMLPQALREEIVSRKGGAIMYGIWCRLRQAQSLEGQDFKPDIFILTDADTTVPLSFEGLLIPEALDRSVGIAIGSAQKTDVRREGSLSQTLYRLYNKFVQFRLSDLKGVEDTLMGFKAARSSVFELILPFNLRSKSNEQPEFDSTFVARMAFDEDMLCRIHSAGHEIKEVPVVWVKCGNESFRLRDRIRAFPDSAFNVPKDIKAWRKRLREKLESWLENNNDYQRWRLIENELSSSVDSDRAATFLWILMSKALYRRDSIRRHLKQTKAQALGHLTRQERVELLSHAISLFLRAPEGEIGYDSGRLQWLKTILKKRNRELLPEARLLIDSYIKLCSTKSSTGDKSSRRINVAIVSHLFGATKKLLLNRMEQMHDIVCLNPDREWTFYWVSQEDANSTKGFPGSTQEAKSALANASQLLKEKIKIIEMSHKELAFIQSVKGGSICFGMMKSIERNLPDESKADYILYSDMNTVPHIAQAGSILAALLEDDNNIVISSRRLPSSVGKRTWFRRMFSYVLNKWIWAHHRSLFTINDSQAGLKGFSREQLEDILPVKADEQGKYAYDLTFDFGLSFEVALMARARKKGYGIVEIPIIDTFEMSTRLQDHPLIRRYGMNVKRAIVTQAEAIKGFNGVWYFIGQGGEYQAFSHPSLNVVLIIPRKTNNFVHSFLVEGGDVAEVTGRKRAMKLANLLLKTSLTKIFFYWYLHHAMRKNRSEEKKRLFEIQENLGEMFVPFTIIDQPCIDVFYSYKYALLYSMRQILSTVAFPFRWLTRKSVNVLIQMISGIQSSIPDRLFDSVSYILRKFVRIVVWITKTPIEKITVPFIRWFCRTWPLRNLLVFIRELLKFDRPGFILIIVLRFLKNIGLKTLYFATEKIQWMIDHSPFMSEVIQKIDLVTRPLWKGIFVITNAVGRLIESMRFVSRLYPEFVVCKEKVVSLGDVLLRLDSEPINQEQSLKEAKSLIDQFVEFQKNLWRRGAFDHESHLLGDVGMDKWGNIVLVDTGVITFNLEEAVQKLRPENKGRDFMTQEVLRRAMSSELYDYYIKRVKEEVTEENIRRLWATEKNSCKVVPAPIGIPDNAFINVTEQEEVERLYDQLIQLAKSRQDERAPEYLDSSKDKATIRTKVILRALRQGGWEERRIAVRISQIAGKILATSNYVRNTIIRHQSIDWEKAFEGLLKGTSQRGLLDSYFNPALLSSTSLEHIFLNIIMDGYLSAKVIKKEEKSIVLEVHGYLRPEKRSGSKSKNAAALIEFVEFSRGKINQPKTITTAVVNRGFGKRQGLLSLQAGSKGDIQFLGRSLKDWVARSSHYLAEVVSDKSRRPLIISPTDVIFLKPHENEKKYLKDVLVSDKAVVFFSPQDKDLNRDLSRPFLEDLGELLFEVLPEVPVIGRILVHKVMIPYLRAKERNELLENHGGYDFPASWIVRYDLFPEAIKLFGFEDYLMEKGVANWWIAFRLPLRVRGRLWKDIGRENTTQLNEESWVEQRARVRRFVTQNGGASARTLIHPWMDCNTPLDIFNIYRGIVNLGDLEWRSRLRELFELNEDIDIVDSKIKGKWNNMKSFFINNSEISIAEGVTLELGENVVIDNSSLTIIGNSCDTVVIPEGTVIAYSNIHGSSKEFQGKGKYNFLHGVYSDSGFNFAGNNRLFVSLIRKGSSVRPELFSQEYEFTSTNSITFPDNNEIDIDKTSCILKRQYSLEPLSHGSCYKSVDCLNRETKFVPIDEQSNDCVMH